MASTEHGLAQGHEIGDRVVAIAYELRRVSVTGHIRSDKKGYVDLLEIIRDQGLDYMSICALYQTVTTYDGLCMIELDSASQSSLCELTQLRDNELIQLQQVKSAGECHWVCHDHDRGFTSLGASCIFNQGSKGYVQSSMGSKTWYDKRKPPVLHIQTVQYCTVPWNGLRGGASCFPTEGNSDMLHHVDG